MQPSSVISVAIDLTSLDSSSSVSSVVQSSQQTVGVAVLTGPAGKDGVDGLNGANGAPGLGLPAGGSTGQFLQKNSNTNYDSAWGDFPPALVTHTFVVSSQAAMLALAANQGDVAIRTDLNSNFILRGTSATTLTDWQELLGGVGNVASVNGQTGSVTLTKSDVGLGSADNTSDLAKPISTLTQAALDNKQPLDFDLTQIAAITPIDDDIIQHKAGVWVNRTPAQVKTDLALTKSDVGLSAVPNIDATQRANHTGTQPSTTISDFVAAVQANRLDQMALPTGPVNMNNHLLSSLSDPVNSQDAVTKAYADALSNGLSVKAPVRVASTANEAVNSASTALDGVTLVLGDRVLLKNQSTPIENGIWIFNGAGSAYTRATDADSSAEIKAGLYVFVTEGTANADAAFVLTTNNPITLGSTGLIFTNFGSTTVPDATTALKGKVQLAGDLGGTASSPKIKRTSRFIVAPYGDTRPADYTCAGAANNHVEINLAITAANALAGGGIVELLDGAFYISSAVIPLDNVWIRGQGMYQTKIAPAAGLTGSFSLVDNFSAHNDAIEPNTKNWILSDLELDGTNMDPTSEGKGLFSIKLEGCKIQRIYCHDTTATGLGADDFVSSVLSDCIVKNCGYLNKHTVTAIVYSTNTFTVTAASHGYAVNDQIVLTGFTPSGYNGKFSVTSIVDANNFTVATSNNAGNFQLSHNPGSATTLGLTSDYNIGHSGIGIATGAATTEATIVTNNICIGNQNNNYLIETNTNITGENATYVFSNNVSINGGQCGFRNTGARNAQFNNNFDYGSLVGAHVVSFTLTRTITAASWAAGVVTFTTSVPHAFQGGNQTIVTGMTPSAYNGNYFITSVPSTTTFTVALASDPGTATVFGGVVGIVHPSNGTFNNNILSANVLYGYYQEPQSDGVSFRGNIVKNCLNIGAYVASGLTNIIDNIIYGHGTKGLYIPTGSSTLPVTNLNILGNQIYNNGWQSAGTYDAIDIDSSTTTPLSYVSIRNNEIFDNQTTQTQRYGVLIRSGGNNSNIQVSNNDLTRNLTAGILVQDTSDTIYVSNNLGVNPTGKSGLGNVTGTVTFDSKLASYFKATVTGNITAVMPAALVDGTIMQWVLVQDATGGWTLTLPGNAASQETLQLSSSANAVDTITWIYDLSTTKWRVLAQSLTKQGTRNLADGANLALGATTGTKIGTSTAQKLAFFNATPITQPSATGDIGTVLSNLGLRAAGTAYPITTSGAVILTGAVALNATTLATDTTTGLKIGGATTQKLGFFNATPVVQPTGDILTALGNLGLVSGGTISEADVTNLTTDLAAKMAAATYDAANIAQQVVGTTATQTMTNKRLTPRINTTASSATPAINVDTTDQFNITALAAAITSMSSGLTGTPTDGQKLTIRIKDNGSARAITWGASFTSSGNASLLATTVISKTHLSGFIYDAAAALWVCVAVDSAGY